MNHEENISHSKLSKHHALNVAGIDAKVLKAFDMNEVANKVYQKTFGSAPSNVSIQSEGDATIIELTRNMLIESD